MGNRKAVARGWSRRTGLVRATILTAAVCLLAASCSPKSHNTNGTSIGSSPGASPSPSPVPVLCPLTGVTPASGSVPSRPALGVKVENSPVSRPPYGLDAADVVYEEPVEGGITRFLAVYQCQDAPRIEPVRSARVADIDILAPLNKPIFGNAGASPPTAQALNSAIGSGYFVNADFNGAGYSRDSARGGGEHSLYTSTQALYGRSEAKQAGTLPKPIFTYDASPAAGGPGAQVHVGFSQFSDVFWRWSPATGVYQRFYGTSPANGSNGSPLSAANVVVQSVPVSMSSWIEDPSGSHQPIPNLEGTGKALVCRKGSCVTGTWSKGGPTQATQYNDATGTAVSLAPGQTWVELAPSSVSGPTAIPVAVVAAS